MVNGWDFRRGSAAGRGLFSGSSQRLWDSGGKTFHHRGHRVSQPPARLPRRLKPRILLCSVYGTTEQAAEKRLPRREKAVTRAEAREIVNDLRGAEAPFFHVLGASEGFSQPLKSCRS